MKSVAYFRAVPAAAFVLFSLLSAPAPAARAQTVLQPVSDVVVDQGNTFSFRAVEAYQRDLPALKAPPAPDVTTTLTDASGAVYPVARGDGFGNVTGPGLLKGGYDPTYGSFLGVAGQPGTYRVDYHVAYSEPLPGEGSADSPRPYRMTSYDGSFNLTIRPTSFTVRTIVPETSPTAPLFGRILLTRDQGASPADSPLTLRVSGNGRLGVDYALYVGSRSVVTFLNDAQRQKLISTGILEITFPKNAPFLKVKVRALSGALAKGEERRVKIAYVPDEGLPVIPFTLVNPPKVRVVGDGQ